MLVIFLLLKVFKTVSFTFSFIISYFLLYDEKFDKNLFEEQIDGSLYVSQQIFGFENKFN